LAGGGREADCVDKFVCAIVSNRYNSDGSSSLCATAKCKYNYLKNLKVPDRKLTFKFRLEFFPQLSLEKFRLARA
jgi:hypothetical protein